MFCVLLLIFTAVAGQQDDAAANQLVDFKKSTKGPIGIMTTSAGSPVEYKEAETVLNSKLLSNEHFVDEMTNFVRERIPERVVHASGTGAFGYFKVTHDISHICKAKLFSKVGKKTPVVARFSLGIASRGVRDSTRDLRGFSVKFYTEEGNLDLLGMNSPIVSINDPLQFKSGVHAIKRNPASNLPDSNGLWDFSTMHPETIYTVLYMFSDYSTPDGYPHMPGFPVHTFEVYNKKGEKSFVRFHFLPDAGIKNLNSTEVSKIAAIDSDYYARDLYNAIANGKYPSWNLKIQVLSEEDVKKAGVRVFDDTRKLPLDLFPLHPVGTLTLNENPMSHFTQIEQLAFSPSNLVPGILGSPNKLFEARCLAYRDAQNYRLGGNFNKIPINCPLGVPALTYNRDGVPPVNEIFKNSPNYYPNSFNGAVPYVDKNRPKLSKIYEKPAYNLDQASNFYTDELTSSERTSLVANLVRSICLCEKSIKRRAIDRLKTINSDLGTRVANGVVANCGLN